MPAFLLCCNSYSTIVKYYTVIRPTKFFENDTLLMYILHSVLDVCVDMNIFRHIQLSINIKYAVRLSQSAPIHS